MAEGTTPTATAVKKTNAAQDQAMANDIGGALKLIDGVAGNAEISALLLKRGYDEAKLAEGRTLQSAAQAAFVARQTALGLEENAVKTLKATAKAASDRYADFRGTARASFTAQADRTALLLNGAVPKDRDKFITQATASYTTAKSGTYQTQMTTDGYDATTLTAALAELTALAQADTAQNQASGAAKLATTARDAAHKSLMTYTKRLRAMAKVALKNRPDLLGQL